MRRHITYIFSFSFLTFFVSKYYIMGRFFFFSYDILLSYIKYCTYIRTYRTLRICKVFTYKAPAGCAGIQLYIRGTVHIRYFKWTKYIYVRVSLHIRHL